MARQELQRRLEELDMSASEAKGYGALLSATQAHMASLLDLLERELLTLLNSNVPAILNLPVQILPQRKRKECG